MQETNRAQTPSYADQQQVTNARTGKVERVFVDLQAVYPNDDDPHEEMSFEELRAQSRGWLGMDWRAEYTKNSSRESVANEDLQQASSPAPDQRIIEKNLDHLTARDNAKPERFASGYDLHDESRARETKVGRPKKMKIMEVKGETQTSKLSSPEFLVGH